jgi:hypothetical protein
VLVSLKTLRAALGAIALASCAVLTSADDAHAVGSPYLEVVDPAEAMRTPAYRYANMTNEEAFAELDRRRILYTKQRATLGVRAPIRLTGRLHGVHVHSSLPPEARPSTPFEILDARLALALDDFCAILERHDVDEIVHYTMYRPNVPPPGFVAQATSASKAGATASAVHSDEPRVGSSRSGKNAKKKPAAKTSLAKGERAGKGSAPPSTRKRSERRKDAYGVDLDEDHTSLDAIADDKVPADELPSEHEHEHDSDDGAKAAPKKSGPTSKPGSGAAKPASTGKSPAPRPTAIGSTSRRTAGAIRRPPPPPRAGGEGDGDHNHGKWAPPGTRHPAGLAIDLGAVRKRDGRWLSVASHFDGKIGQRTCGAGAPVSESANAKELQAIVCEARAAGVFTYALTPNFNQDHVDHVHFEIKPGVTWFLFH